MPSNVYFDIEERIQQALNAIKRDKSPNIAAYARKFEVPEQRLRNRWKGRQSRSERAPVGRKLNSTQEASVVDYMKRFDSLSMPVTVSMVRATANHVLQITHDDLSTPPPRVGSAWTGRFLKRHPEFKKRKSKPLEACRSAAQDRDVIQHWFEVFKTLIEDEGILPCDIWNFDETGFNIGAAGDSIVLTRFGNRRQYSASSENRTRVSSIESINGAGDYLPPVHILPGKVLLDSWFPDLDDDVALAISDSGYSNDQIGFDYIQHFDEYSAKFQQGAKRVVIVDNHESHLTATVFDYCNQRNIILLALPAHTTHLLQPLDVNLFQPLKHWHKQALEYSRRTGCYDFNKVEFLAEIGNIRRQAFKRRSIIDAWAKTGLIPYNPTVVLSKIQEMGAPPAHRATTPPGCPPPGDMDRTPQTPRSLLRHAYELLEQVLESQILAGAVDYARFARWWKGAYFQAVSGAEAKNHLLMTGAAESARRERQKRRATHAQKGGILKKGKWSEIQAKKAVEEAQKRAGREKRAARKAEIEQEKAIRAEKKKAREEDRLARLAAI